MINIVEQTEINPLWNDAPTWASYLMRTCKGHLIWFEFIPRIAYDDKTGDEIIYNYSGNMQFVYIPDEDINCDTLLELRPKELQHLRKYITERVIHV